MNRLTVPLAGLLDAGFGDWQPLLNIWRCSAAGQALIEAVDRRVREGAVLHPGQVFRAFALTPLARTRVLILGQDPYHGEGQAEGLAFFWAVDPVEADMLSVVIVLYFDGVALDDTNDGAGEFGGTVIGIHAYFEVRPCGSGKTDEQQHKWYYVVRDGALHKEAAVGAKHEGRRRLAGGARDDGGNGFISRQNEFVTLSREHASAVSPYTRHLSRIFASSTEPSALPFSSSAIVTEFGGSSGALPPRSGSSVIRVGQAMRPT